MSEPGWCYVVTLSATGGPATASLPPPPQHLQTGSASQPLADVSAAAVQSKTALGVTGEQADSSSAAPAIKPPVHFTESQGNSTSHTATSEQSHSDSQFTHQDGDNQSEQPLHAALAGMSLGENSPELPPHVSASERAQAGTEQHRQSTASSFDDPLRRGQLSSTQQGVQGEDQQLQVTMAQDVIDLPLFTGFVSHEQLETAIGSTSYERRLASSRELTHWVKMRGPGVLCFLVCSD